MPSAIPRVLPDILYLFTAHEPLSHLSWSVLIRFGTIYAEITIPKPNQMKYGAGNRSNVVRNIIPNPMQNKSIPVFVHNGHENMKITTLRV